MINNWTLFGNGSGSASSGNGVDYLQDVFLDVTNNATSNSGFTSTAATNPLGANFFNDDLPKYSAKTLYIKDYVLIQDRSKWINGEPTYQITWSDNVTPIVGYAWGDYDQGTGTFRKIGDGIGITGVMQRIAFITKTNSSSTATAQIQVDGVNGATIDFSNSIQPNLGYYQPVHAASNESFNIHDFRIIAKQVNTLSVVGVVVYHENSGSNIDCFPGSTYVDKTKVTTAVRATLSLPALGSSLGGRSSVYKNTSSAYALSNQSASMISSTAIGLSGSNLVLLNTGDGSNFNVGDGFLIDGVTAYIGQITSISTDTLTLNPALSLGASGLCYRLWSAGPTYAISSSLMTLKYSIDFSKQNFNLSTNVATSVYSPDQKWSMVSLNAVSAVVDGYNSFKFSGASSAALNVSGFFSAAEIEYCGSGINNFTLMVNNVNAWSINEGQTGLIKKTVFTNGGPQWNSFEIQVGTSLGTSLGITRINLYQCSRNIGQSFGLLSEFDTLQSYVQRSVGASQTCLGMFQRTYADNLFFQLGGSSGWIRGATFGAAGGVQYISNDTNAAMKYDFYGKEFAIIGSIGSSYGFTIDGGSTTTLFNTPLSAATLGFHSIVYTHKNGTSIIQAIDFRRPSGELTSLQNKSPLPVPAPRVGQLEFDLYGPYPSAGSAQTGVIYMPILRDILITGCAMYVLSAGSTGRTTIDISYNQRLSSGYSSIFISPPFADPTMGDNSLWDSSVLSKYPFYIPAGSILRFDLLSTMIGGNGLLTRLYYQEL
jgi:hypothetical protein